MMKIHVLLLSSLVLGWFSASEELRAAEPSQVVRVNVTSQGYNFRLPWQKKSPASRNGLGAVIAEAQVLVTAQLVANATYIELEQPVSGDQISAQVKWVDYECNLALLEAGQEVDKKKNKAFWEQTAIMALDRGAEIGDSLEVLQIESTGSQISNEVKVSQIETGRYFLDSIRLLLYKTRGPLQSHEGSFTLPVVKEGKLVGLLLGYDSKEQLSTIIATPIVKHFLDDAKDGEYGGFPNLGIAFSQTLDPQLRSHLKIEEEEGGVLISKMVPGHSAELGGLEEGDVIMSIDGFAIDARGYYKDTKLGKVSMSHLVRGKPFVGDEVEVEIFRAGQKLSKQVKLQRKAPEAYLVDPYMFDRAPKYLVMGGLVFQELTVPYLQAFGSSWKTQAPFKLAFAASNPHLYEEEGVEKLVFLSGVLPTDSVQGYERLGSLLVKEVNGKKIGDLKSLNDAFASPVDGLHEVRFDEYPKVIHLEAAKINADNLNVLPTYYRIQELSRLE